MLVRRLSAYLKSPQNQILEHRFFSTPWRHAQQASQPRGDAFVFGESVDRNLLRRNLLEERLIFVRATRRGLYTRETLRLAAQAGPSRWLFADLPSLRAAARNPEWGKAPAYLITYSPLRLALGGEAHKGLWLHALAGSGFAADLSAETEAPFDLKDFLRIEHASGASGTRLEALFVGPAFSGAEAARLLSELARGAPRRGGERVYLPNPLALDSPMEEEAVAAALAPWGFRRALPEERLTDLAARAESVHVCDGLTARLLETQGAAPTLLDLAMGTPLRDWATKETLRLSAARIAFTDFRRLRPISSDEAWLGLRSGARSDEAFISSLYREGVASEGLYAAFRRLEAEAGDEAAQIALAKGLRAALEAFLARRGPRSTVLVERLPVFERYFAEAKDAAGLAFSAAIRVGGGAGAGKILAAVGMEALRDPETIRLVRFGLWGARGEKAKLVDLLRAERMHGSAAALSLEVEPGRRGPEPGPAEAAAETEAGEALWEDRFEAIAPALQSADEEEARQGRKALKTLARSLESSLDTLKSSLRNQAILRVSQLHALAGDHKPALYFLRNHARSPRRSGFLVERYFALLMLVGAFDEELEEKLREAAGGGASAADLALLLQMLVYAGESRKDQAQEWLRRALQAYPKNIGLLANAYAHYLPTHADLSGQREIFTELFHERRLEPRMADLFARILVADGDPQGAARLLDAARAISPAHEGLLSHRADLAERLDEHALAFELLTEQMEAQPDRLRLIQRWARAAQRAARAEPWIQTLETRHRRTYLEPYEMIRLGALHMEAGRVGEGYAWGRKALAAEPASADLAETALAWAKLNSDREGASEIFHEFARHAHREPLALLRLSNLARSNGVVADYEAYALQATKSSSFNLLYHMAAARDAIESNRYAEARRHALAGLKINPSSIEAYAVATLALLGEGDAAEAERLVSVALRVRPYAARNLYLMAKTAEEEGAPAEALAWARRSAQARDRNGEAQDLRNGWMISTTGGLLGEPEAMREGVDRIRQALHQAAPTRFRPWGGESLAEARVLFMNRGGPGDELRIYSALFQGLYEQAARCVVVGDGRLREIFRLNFPKAEFIANPWQGRRFAKLSGPVPPRFADRLEPGSTELLRRFNAYLPDSLEEGFDHLVWSEDLVRHLHFAQIETRPFSPWRRELALPERPPGAAERQLGAWSDEARIGIVWRGSYFSQTRRPKDVLSVEEIAPLARIPGVRLIDLHPQSFPEEQEEMTRLFGAPLARLEGLDMMNDFTGLGRAMRAMDALIIPGVTQRDLAAAVGAPRIWSFSVAEGSGEMWRVHRETRADLWQKGIEHHTRLHYDSREAILEALRRKCVDLRDEISARRTAGRALKTSAS